MRSLAEGYGGVWKSIAEHITDPAKINYARFDRLLVEGSWHRGRIVLAGDAAHACPPTLAQGAAMDLEDALANPMNELIAKESFNDIDRGVFIAPPV
jgi:2-polyprenyl-6-methoxyphenol hydroxylase-like FAD-dependent oxidoreductase